MAPVRESAKNTRYGLNTVDTVVAGLLPYLL